jgi:hypothetical protein
MALLDIRIEDRVFCIHYGWGTVKSLSGQNNYPIEVYFDNYHNDSYNLDGKLFDYMMPTLSFKEYKFEGFTQERPEVLPNIGDIVWGKSFLTTDWSIGHFLGKQNASYKISSVPNASSYWLADKITTKNPYTNEGSI